MTDPSDSPAPAWSPAPDESAAIKLPDFLAPLVERLAEKVHDRWAAQRLEEGWTYGPERNDTRRTTPNLVAYADLPDIEKNYDRATALTTLRALYREGYRITAAAKTNEAAPDEARVVAEALEGADGLRFEAADLLWRGHTPEFWRQHPALLYRLARRASDAGWPLLAYDMVSRTLAPAAEEEIPADFEARLRYLAALSLMEVGALERAAQEINRIGGAEWLGGDLQGLRGRLAKVRGLRAADADEARRCFEEARGVYEEAYDAARDLFAKENSLAAGGSAYYLGINAASMAAWSGHGEEARRRAGEVLDICAAVEKARGGPSPDPWLEATRGEAHLLRHDGAAAGAAYRAAASALPGQWRPLQSMRRQALETARRTGFPENEAAGWFRLPEVRVAGLDGGTAPPDGAIVFYYLRDPAQLPAAAALAESSAEFHLGLEQPLEKFRARLTPEQDALLEKITARATRVLGQKETQIVREEISPALARAFFCGSVLLRARELDTPAVGLPRLESADLDFRTDGGSPFRAVLCADAKGYSRLDAPRLRVFAREFLGRVGAAVDRFRAQTVTVKTAGDGLFMVFHDLASAIRFSLELRDTIRAVDWGAFGLPDDLGLRISLDAGPVLEFDDPVTGYRDVAGSLVNRAARIEPITPVNHVYASRTVAALATALELPGVRFEYAGETPLPKGFGAFQLYHLTAA